MTELAECLQTLGLRPGASQEEVKKAYRELAMVWHPDRFPEASPLQAKASEKLKELNHAYRYVLEHGFVDGVPIIPPVEPSPDTGSPPQPHPPEHDPAPEPQVTKRGLMIAAALAVLIICLCGASWWLSRKKDSSGDSPKISETAEPTMTNVTSLPRTQPEVSSSTTSSPTSTVSLPNPGLGALRAVEGCVAAQQPEGLSLSNNGRAMTSTEYSPPFTIHAVAKTDLTNLRIHWGKGRLVFNWEVNPKVLRYIDPRTGVALGLPGQGQISVNEWQDIRWAIEANGSRVLVNGVERGQFKGDYAGLVDVVGIGSAAGSKVTVRSFEVETTPSQHASAPPDVKSGLVLYFTFDGVQNGVVADASGFRNNGKVTGGMTVPDGKLKGAFKFEGRARGGDGVIVPSSPSLVSMQQTRQLTICAWLKPFTEASRLMTILGKGGAKSVPAGGYELTRAPRHDFIFQSGAYHLETHLSLGRWLSQHLNEWTHVALVVDSKIGARKWYINGQRTGDEQDSGSDCTELNYAVPTPLYIGTADPKLVGNRSGFNGLIDELRIYARALTVEEIRALPGFDK